MLFRVGSLFCGVKLCGGSLAADIVILPVTYNGFPWTCRHRSERKTEDTDKSKEPKIEFITSFSVEVGSLEEHPLRVSPLETAAHRRGLDSQRRMSLSLFWARQDAALPDDQDQADSGEEEVRWGSG